MSKTGAQTLKISFGIHRLLVIRLGMRERDAKQHGGIILIREHPSNGIARG